MIVARRVRATGRVQGVWFRAWTKEQADALGVRGWVRNCQDGSVEAHVEGENDAVDEIVGLMRRGPSAARVDDLQSEETDTGGFSGFDVRD